MKHATDTIRIIVSKQISTVKKHNPKKASMYDALARRDIDTFFALLILVHYRATKTLTSLLNGAVSEDPSLLSCASESGLGPKSRHITHTKFVKIGVLRKLCHTHDIAQKLPSSQML